MTLSQIRAHVRLIARIGHLDVVPIEDGSGVVVYADNDRVEVARGFATPAGMTLDAFVASLEALKQAA
jgi:hypothetical protein